jgi:hypothetical protein
VRNFAHSLPAPKDSARSPVSRGPRHVARIPNEYDGWIVCSTMLAGSVMLLV